MALIPYPIRSKKDLVSVVISTYKGEKFISEALESIANQTYSNWEVIVVEDGSCDGTEQIVKDFAKQNRWHRVDFSRSPSNQGLGHTRNLTFAKAQGEYIAILDADDRWTSDHLEAAVRALKASGKDIAFSTSLMFEDQTEVLLGTWGPSASDLADFAQSLFGRNFVTPSATVFRRQVVADVGPWDTFQWGEDISYWLRSVAAGKRFQFVGGCHCHYRKNHVGAMTQTLSAMLEGVAEVTKRFMDLPGTRPSTCREYQSNSYELAARFHATADPLRDPSADRTRAPLLLVKAWQLRPKRVGYLWRATKIWWSELLRRQKRQPSVKETSFENSAIRAAA